MRYMHDTELKGHAMVFDGPLELMEMTEMAWEKNPEAANAALRIKPKVEDEGRTGEGWKTLRGFLKTPWPEAVKTIHELIEIVKQTLPTPESIQRHKEFTQTEGELVVERLLKGEAKSFQTTVRKKKTGPSQIALLCNLDYSPSLPDIGVFYRSASAIAATDLLEAAGYTVELWMWCLGRNVYPSPDHRQFTTCRLKESGMPVDIDSLCDTMSRWFTTKGIFGSFMCCPVMPVSIGSLNFDLGEWKKYMDVTPNVQEVHVPIVYGTTETIAAAHQVIHEATTMPVDPQYAMNL